MRFCQVLMQLSYEIPDEELIACGETANKKMGFVWVCNYHYDMFRDCIDSGFAEHTNKVIDDWFRRETE